MSDDALPATMTCVEISEPGGPEVLSATTRPTPTPATGEVLIKVAAAGINGPDVYQRRGLYPPPPGATDIPGLEVSGTIVALGTAPMAGWHGRNLLRADRRRWLRRVLRRAGGAVPADPATASTLIDAAALPETFFTVWTNVFERARLAPGETPAGAWRRRRHRHHGDPDRRQRSGHRVFTTAAAGAVRAAAASWARPGPSTSRRGLRRRHQGGNQGPAASTSSSISSAATTSPATSPR